MQIGLGTVGEHAANETGAVLVLFAVFASVAVLMLAFVLDAGNWFAHQRHLQVQADAAALAAATELSFPCTKAEAEAIYKTAGQYGGAASVTAAKEPGPFSSATPLYNEPVGGTAQSNIHEEINKKTYFGQSAEDNTVEEAPCAPSADMVDVKLTETELPWFFQALNVRYINAHARVSVKAESEASAVEPVVESEPEAGRAYILNDGEDKKAAEAKTMENAEVMKSLPLTRVGPSGKGGVIWGSAAPVKLAVTNQHIGLRVALAGNTEALKTENEHKPEACLHANVECFVEHPFLSEPAIVPPLVNISGYPTTGTGTVAKPLARRVTLSTPPPDTCTDGYFTNYLGGPECTFTISAEVNYGGATNATGASTNKTGVTIVPEVVTKPEIAGEEKHKEATGLACEPCTGLWTGLAKINKTEIHAPLEVGSSQINLIVTCKPVAGAPCTKEEKGTLEDVQRIFTAGPASSNRIVGAWICEAPVTVAECATGKMDANSFAMSTEHELVIAIELSGSLEPATKFENGEGPYRIKYGNSSDHAIDNFVIACPPEGGTAAAEEEAFRKTLEAGCKGRYALNTTNPECKAIGEPYQCVEFLATKNGNYQQNNLTKVFESGITNRIIKPPVGLKYECPNRWEENNGKGVPTIPSKDSRLMQLFVVPYASYKQSEIAEGKSRKVPIKKFATFYVTGWAGLETATEPCNQQLEKLTKKEREQLEKEGRYHLDNTTYPERDRELVGHLIKYVTHIGEGAGTVACKEEAIETCETVLSE